MISNILDNKDSNKNVMPVKTIKEAVLKADAILILTDWSDYKNIDFDSLSTLMRKPSWVFDTRDVVDIEKCRNAGLKIWKLGNGC